MKKIIILIPVFLCLYSTAASGQGIYANKLTDLNFGNVYMGYPAEVLDTDIQAASFIFYHQRGRKDIQVEFNLPATLDYGSESFPIIFDFDHSTWSFYNQISGRTNFDPHAPLIFESLKNRTDVFIWIGGKINPPSNITPGQYSGTIIMIVEIF